MSESLPTVDGYTWAASPAQGIRRSHLVKVGDVRSRYYSATLCGQQSWDWRDGLAPGELASCRRCEAKARAGGAS